MERNAPYKALTVMDEQTQLYSVISMKAMLAKDMDKKQMILQHSSGALIAMPTMTGTSWMIQISMYYAPLSEQLGGFWRLEY